jgi:hypothetical protein
MATKTHARPALVFNKRLSQMRNERRKLASQLLKLDAELAKLETPRALERAATSDEIDRWFADLSDGLPTLPPLPADFSRGDIYDEHD